MPNKRIVAAAIAAIGLTVPLIQWVRAATFPDVRQEDRREDGREDRRKDQREDQRDEARLDVPRTAAGAIDLQRLVAEIRALFDRGVREVRIREERLTAQERQQVAQTVQQFAGQLNLERVRVRQDDDRLRIELRNEREQRAERREDRREDFRREDRREDRAERRENRPERVARVERNERAERPERHERVERVERVERPERGERAERVERPERGGPGRH
jgi:hypothetical protein